ncbi:MAG: O-antigen ligase family protein [Pseudomonadota bacterium]
MSPFIYFYMLCMLFAFGGTASVPFVMTWMLFLLPVGLSVFWSLDIEYGMTKAVNLVVTTSLSLCLILSAIERSSWLIVQRVLLAMLTGLLVLAVLYKLRAGFFDRDVPFFINGPIVFGRLMSIAAILSAFVLRGFARVVAVTVFGLAVIWTASKGPLLGLVGLLSLIAFVRANWLGRALIVLVPVTGAALLLTGVWTLEYDGSNRLLVVADLVLSGGNLFSDAGPLGGRIGLYRESMSLILAKPFGVGLGGWELAVTENYGLYYPHNFFLELFSECGFVFGAIALVPFLAFTVTRFNAAGACALFLLIAQQVSGDLLDARYLLLMSLLAVWLEKNKFSGAKDLQS